MIWRLTWSEKARGRRMRCIRASSGVRLPFWWLHRLQHATRLSHDDSPPRERGSTWSSVSSDGVNCRPQYWQVEWSRSRMFLRESERLLYGMCMYSTRRMTDGACIVMRAEWSMCPLCSSMRAMPLKIITTARRSVQTFTGSYEAFRTKTRPVISLEDITRRGKAVTSDRLVNGEW